MSNPYQYLRKRLSTRLSIWVLIAVTVLFVAALVIMFRFSHAAVEKESLEKAQGTLKGTVLRIENMLHEVEGATTSIQWEVEHHLDDPNAMDRYTREIVRNNPNIRACAIAFEPNYYEEKGELFMVYSFRTEDKSDEIVTNHNPMEIEPHLLSHLPYLAHNWYVIPKKENTACWIRPHAPNEDVLSSIVTCSMPLHDSKGNIVGIIASDISVDWLSNTILSTKPYPNSYCTMLGVQGTYLIHPDSTRLYHTLVRDVIKDSPDKRAEELVQAMLDGQTGCRAVNLFGKDCYVLFRPLNNKHWSACIVCPESDIFSANETLKYHTMVITLIGILIIFIFCLVFISYQLKPLDMLEHATQNITEGDFSETIPATSRKDEIGILQNSFSLMQQSLAKYIKKISQLSTVLKDRNESLVAISAQIQDIDRMKTTVIHKIADKMIPPALAIDGAINELDKKQTNIKQEEIPPLSDKVMTNIKTITELLNQMDHISQKKNS